MYEIEKEIYGVLNLIVLSINKTNSIIVHEKEDNMAKKKVLVG